MADSRWTKDDGWWLMAVIDGIYCIIIECSLDLLEYLRITRKVGRSNNNYVCVRVNACVSVLLLRVRVCVL